MHGGYTKIKMMTFQNRFAMDLECRQCKWRHKNVEHHNEKFHDSVETMTNVFVSMG